MNAFARYLPSPDIRAHLETLGYTLTPREAASALWLTDALPLAEKHAKLRELLENAPELRSAADWDAMLAWEKAAALLLLRREEAAPFEVMCAFDYDTFPTAEEAARRMAQRGFARGVLTRSELPECAGLCGRLGADGKLTRVVGDSAPKAVQDAWAFLGAENLHLPVPFAAGDALELCDIEEDLAFLAGTPLLLLETDPDSGQAVCAVQDAGFPVETYTVPYVLLRAARDGDAQLTEHADLRKTVSARQHLARRSADGAAAAVPARRGEHVAAQHDLLRTA